MDFHTLLGDAARKLNLDTAGLAAQTRSFELLLPGDMLVTVELLPGEEMIAISGLLCRFPEAGALPGLFALLLESHGYGLATDGSAFSIDRERSQVILFRNLDLDGLDGDRLMGTVKRFVAALALWRDAYSSGRILQKARGEAPAVTTAAAAQPDFA